MERRECTRYRLACQVRFSWARSHSGHQRARSIYLDGCLSTGCGNGSPEDSHCSRSPRCADSKAQRGRTSAAGRASPWRSGAKWLCRCHQGLRTVVSMMDEAAMAARIGRKIKGLRGIPMSNQRVLVRGHFIRGSEQTIYRELSRKEERRQQSRYGLRARVDFRWKDREKFYHHGEGFTRDISPTGMFVYADSHPPPKADIRVEVFFSPLAEGVSALQIECESARAPRGPAYARRTTGWICGGRRNLCAAQDQNGRKESRPR